MNRASKSCHPFLIVESVPCSENGAGRRENPVLFGVVRAALAVAVGKSARSRQGGRVSCVCACVAGQWRWSYEATRRRDSRRKRDGAGRTPDSRSPNAVPRFVAVVFRERTSDRASEERARARASDSQRNAGTADSRARTTGSSLHRRGIPRVPPARFPRRVLPHRICGARDRRPSPPPPRTIATTNAWRPTRTAIGQYSK